MRARVNTVLVSIGALVAGSVIAIVGVAAPAAAVAPTGAPSLISPVGDTVSSNPVLHWTSVTGATKYRVQVAASPAFSTLAYGQDTVSLNATPPTDLPTGTLYWRVAAVNNDGAGPFSSTASFTKNWDTAPTPTQPGYDETLDFPQQPVVFAWDPLPGAKSYTLEIGTESDIISPIVSVSTSNTTYTLTDPQTFGQQYWWHVRAVSGTSGVVSQWSDARPYEFGWSSQPQLQEPGNGDTVDDVNFSWDAVPGAATYDLQVSPNGDWANNITFDVTVKGTAYSPTSTMLNGSYFWRVQAIDASSHKGLWSDTWQFTRAWTPTPSLLTPAWNPADPNVIPHITGDPVLSWTKIDHAAYYEIQVSTDPNFSSGITNCYTNHLSWTPYSRLVPSSNPGEPGTCGMATLAWSTGIVYYWRVRGIDPGESGAVPGLWSSVGNNGPFRFIRDPDAPTQTAPANGAAVDTPTLTWDPVQGAEKYRVTIKSGTTTLSGYPVTTYATSYTPAAKLVAGTTYGWYVQAVDANGVISAAPTQPFWWTFAVNTNPTTGALALLTPADGSSSVRMPMMSWVPVAGADHYVVHYAAHGFELTPLTSTQPYAAYTDIRVPLTPDTYTWWVEAFNGATSLATSEPRTLTLAALDVVPDNGYLSPDRCTLPCTAITDTPTFSWNPVPAAGAYVVTVANDANFTNIVRSYETAYTTLTPRESLLDNQAGQAYYWFVRPCIDSARTRCGPGPDDSTVNFHASAFQKRSSPITGLTPADGTHLANLVTFCWQDYAATESQEAKQYRIQISTAADFTSTLDTVVTDGTCYTPAALTYPEGPLYWRVQAIDGSGNNLTWSGANIVSKDSPAPTETFPADGASASGVPYLQWQQLPFAAKYTVEVYKNGDTNWSSANRLLTATTKFAAWAPTTGLPGGEYAWRVRALDADGKPGPWSAGRTFDLNPAAPTLLAPADSIVITSVDQLFAWTAVAGAAQYKWEVSPNASFTTLTTSQTTVMTSWAPVSTINDGSYFWRVKALDGNGNVLATSGSRTFSKDGAAPTVTAKSPTASAPVNGAFSVTFSEQVTGVSASTFTLHVAGTATTIPGAVQSPTSTTATFTPTSPLTPGQSYTATLTSGITDLAGNPLAAYSWTTRAEVKIENTSPAFHETWDRHTSASASGGAFSVAQTSGFSARFAFEGTDVALVGARSSSGGYANVSIDGGAATKVSFYHSSTQWQRAVWSKSGLADARHAVVVTVLGSKPSAAKATNVYIDAFKVAGTTYQENDAHVTDSFRRVKSSAASGGSYDLATHVSAGHTGSRPSYSVTFRGTRVSVYGTRTTTSGTAAVYIDGKLTATVSFNGTTAYGVQLFGSASLKDKTHTIRVEVLGTRTGKNSSVAIDYVAIA